MTEAYRQFASCYDQLMEDMPYPKWLQFIENRWQQIEPKVIVDLGCGTGNLTIPLAQKGYHMTGIDRSASMLSIAQQKMEQRLQNKESLKIQWIEQDMMLWQLPDSVDAVISCCDSINYLLEKEQVLQTFQRTYDGLREDGIFIFDVHTELQLREYANEQPFVWDEDELAYIWHCSLDESRCEMVHDLTIFVQQGKWYQKIEEVHIQRAYPLEWLSVSLSETGFRKVDLYADFTYEPVSKRTKRAFFVAYK